MKKDTVRVSPNADSGWRVHKSWWARDIAHCDNKAEAVNKARDIAQNQKTEVIIQKRDGQIGERNSYWKDPFPPRG